MEEVINDILYKLKEHEAHYLNKLFLEDREAEEQRRREEEDKVLKEYLTRFDLAKRVKAMVKERLVEKVLREMIDSSGGLGLQ